ncbi:MAG TPA: hypothetical protein VM934_14305 [Pyrinomonadaceae bacterium]|jgi:hypothetical protein|nr:hypothetical protein [Pyrinomonadaceae bacterium]
MKSTVKPALWFAATLTLSAMVAPCAGQQGTTGQRGGRPIADPATREVERQLENDRKSWGFRIETRQPAEQQYQRLVFTQISEDFLRIQVLNDELAKATLKDGPLDLKFVAQTTSDIKKLANRLKFNLALPEPEKDGKRPRPGDAAEPGELKQSLTALDKLIAKFVHNPVFKDANVVDAKLSAQARLDLEEIIELSGQVKKRSEQLHKSAFKSQ